MPASILPPDGTALRSSPSPVDQVRTIVGKTGHRVHYHPNRRELMRLVESPGKAVFATRHGEKKKNGDMTTIVEALQRRDDVATAHGNLGILYQAFGDWTDADWKALDKTWRSWAKKLADD